MSNQNQSQKPQILEGSQAIAHIINHIRPAVISAYPITPQTHIVEDLAKLKADGKAKYEYVRAESEFAAASIIAGASATGVRVYSATSSQGLLLMTEVLFNIAGMRLPAVLTCANRGVSAPITIWNDHQDAMTLRDSGWIMFFAEDHQEAVDQHVLAYKIAEQTNLPVMVNIDGFVLTHTYDSVIIPSESEVKKFLPEYKAKKNMSLDTENPTTMGAFAAPAYYMEIRQDLHKDMVKSEKTINHEYEKYHKLINTKKYGNGLVEYYGPKNPRTVFIAMGSVVGTIKDFVDENKNIGVLKIKTYRPFPAQEILKYTKKAKYVAVLEKSISLGASGPLYSDVKTATNKKLKAKIQNFIIGLGGRDVTAKMLSRIADEVKKKNNELKFIG